MGAAPGTKPGVEIIHVGGDWNDTAEPVSNWIGLLFQVITPSPN